LSALIKVIESRQMAPQFVSETICTVVKNCISRSYVVATIAVIWDELKIYVLSTIVFQTLIVSLVLTRLDYCNAMLAGIPATLLNHLKSVL